MHITEIIQEFVKIYRQNNNLSFTEYYNSFVEAKTQINFDEDCDKWNNLYKFIDQDFNQIDIFEEVKNDQIQEIFDVLIDNYSNQIEYEYDGFRDFFEMYNDKVSDKQLLIIYKKYFDNWYYECERCAPHIILDVLERVVNMYEKETKKSN